MSRRSSLVALPIAAAAMLSAVTMIQNAPDAAAQATPVVKPTTAPPAAKPAAPAPAVKPAAATTTAPRAGGVPLELAGALVAGGTAVAGGGLYALRRRRRRA